MVKYSDGSFDIRSLLGDSMSWESREKEDGVYPLFI